MIILVQSVHLATLFFWASIFSLVTDNNPSWIRGREENDRRNFWYFMINLQISMGPNRDQTRKRWICSQTRTCSQAHYRLRYATKYYLSYDTRIIFKSCFLCENIEILTYIWYIVLGHHSIKLLKYSQTFVPQTRLCPTPWIAGTHSSVPANSL